MSVIVGGHNSRIGFKLVIRTTGDVNLLCIIAVGIQIYIQSNDVLNSLTKSIGIQTFTESKIWQKQCKYVRRLDFRAPIYYH